MNAAQRVGTVIAAVGGIAIIVGVIIGLVPVFELGQSCGSGFAPSDAYGNLACVQQTNPMRLAAWLLIILGAALVIGGLYEVANRATGRSWR